MENMDLKLCTELAQASPSPVMDSIGEIRKSVHNHYPMLLLQDGSKDEAMKIDHDQLGGSESCLPKMVA